MVSIGQVADLIPAGEIIELNFDREDTTAWQNSRVTLMISSDGTYFLWRAPPESISFEIGSKTTSLRFATNRIMTASDASVTVEIMESELYDIKENEGARVIQIMSVSTVNQERISVASIATSAILSNLGDRPESYPCGKHRKFRIECFKTSNFN